MVEQQAKRDDVEPVYQCDICEQDFKTRLERKDHLEKTHNVLTGFEAWWERRKSYHP